MARGQFEYAINYFFHNKIQFLFLTDQEYIQNKAYEEETTENGGNEKDSELQYSADLCLVYRHTLWDSFLALLVSVLFYFKKFLFGGGALNLKCPPELLWKKYFSQNVLCWKCPVAITCINKWRFSETIKQIVHSKLGTDRGGPWCWVMDIFVHRTYAYICTWWKNQSNLITDLLKIKS